jgi:hypothetical protein
VLTALAAIIVTTAIGGASASATVLCKSSDWANCPAGDTYGVGTELSAALKTKTKLKFSLPNGTTWSECENSNLKVQVTDAGSASTPVKTKDISYSMSGCTYSTSVPQLGTWTIGYTGAGAGNITDNGTRIRANYFGLNCTYRFPEEYMFEFGLNGGSSARIGMSTEIEKAEGPPSCPELLRMAGEYTVSSPAPLYVEARSEAVPVVLCKANEEHCAEANRYGVGTGINASLAPKTSVELVNVLGETIVRCETSTLKGAVSNAGGAGSESVKESFTSASFGECTSTEPLSAEALPWEAETRIPVGSTENGNQLIKGMQVKAKTVLFGTCIWKGNPKFNVTGGAPAELTAVAGTLEKQTGSAFACPPVTVKAHYQLSAPNPLYVTAP